MSRPIRRPQAAPAPDLHPMIAGEHAPPITDPALADFAHFSFWVESSFNGGPGEGFNGYDRDAHRYHRSYINPRSYRLQLDARLGLMHGPANIALARNVPDRPAFTSIDDFVDLVGTLTQVRGGIGGGGGGRGGRMVPDDLVAYVWVVTGEDGALLASHVIQRPFTPMYIAHADLPGEGTYEIWLRVVFSDNRQGERRARFRLRDWFIVSLGDSAASGEGNPDMVGTIGLGGGTVCEGVTTASIARDWEPQMSNEPVWIEREAHRSMRSGPALAALAVQQAQGSTLSGPGTVTLDKVVFASFARSGADITDGLISAQQHPDDYIGVGQLEECRRTAASRRIDALMISIGGNDIGFSGVLTDLVRGDLPDSVWNVAFSGNDAAARQAVADRLDRLLGVGLPAGQPGELEVRFNTLRREVDALRQDPGVDEVYISGYPTAPFSNRDANGDLEFRSCGIFLGPDLSISVGDNAVLESRGQQLNDLIRRKAEEFGWHYVDVADEFQGHGYCSSDDSTFWVRAEESCRRQGDFRGTMHPNYRGHAVYALALATALREHTFVPPRRPGPERPVVLLPGAIARP